MLRQIGHLAALSSLDDPSQRPWRISVNDGMIFRESGRAVGQSGSGDATRTCCLFFEQVDRGEWDIERIAAQDIGRVTARHLGAPLFW